MQPALHSRAPGAPHLDWSRSNEDFARDATIARACGPPRLRLIVSGWVGEVLELSDGRRQIIRLLIPGDFCGSIGASNACSLVALTRVRTALQDILAAPADPENPQHARLNALLAAAAERKAEALVTHVVRLGRMSAYERTAHLFLELFDRLSAAGLVQGSRMPLPLTQEHLADVLGLSIVHVNRTLQQLRRDGLVECRASALSLLDRERLEQICNYRPRRLVGGRTAMPAPASSPAIAPRGEVRAFGAVGGRAGGGPSSSAAT